MVAFNVLVSPLFKVMELGSTLILAISTAFSLSFAGCLQEKKDVVAKIAHNKRTENFFIKCFSLN